MTFLKKYKFNLSRIAAVILNFALDKYPLRVYYCGIRMWNLWKIKKAVAVTKQNSAVTKSINRLNRIEGQIRGIKGMVENDAYCTDIITQVAAATAALNSFNKQLLSEHIKTCVTDDIKAGKTETVDDLLNTLQKLMR